MKQKFWNKFTETKLISLELELKKQLFFLVCGTSNITPSMATRSATVDLAVKWRFKSLKRIEFASGRFL